MSQWSLLPIDEQKLCTTGGVYKYYLLEIKSIPVFSFAPPKTVLSTVSRSSSLDTSGHDGPPRAPASINGVSGNFTLDLAPSSSSKRFKRVQT